MKLNNNSRIVFRSIMMTIATLFFFSCAQKNNDRIYQQFENEFNSQISENHATSFLFDYDGLTPQISYFVNSKIKFMKYTLGPENGSVESLIFYKNYTDSLNKIVRRYVFYEWDDIRNERTNKYSDTIYLICFDKNKTYKYADNKIIDSSFNKYEYEFNNNFTHQMKVETEKQYNSR